MITSLLTRKAVLGLVGAGLLAATSASGARALSTPGPVTKATPCVTQAEAVKAGASIDTLRALGDCEIQRRFTTLDDLSAAVSKAKALTTSDAAALSGEISSTRAGLTALKATIDAETSLEALRGEVRQIATDYRVYLLLVPKTHLVIAADREVAAQQIFDKVSDRLSAAIQKAKDAGKDVTAAQADLDKMNAAVAQAVALASPLPAQLLPLTPAQYNAGTAGPVLLSARSAVLQARDLLRQAKADAEACRDALQALK